MNKPRYGAIVAIVVPLALALVFGLMCLNQFKHRDLALKKQAEEEANVRSKQQILDLINSTPLTDKTIALVNTPDEQAAFLTQLRVNAQNANVKLVQYTNMGVVVPPKQENAPPTIFRPVASNLTVQGPYMGTRAFAFSLLRANRLMNMNNVNWKRDSDGATTTLSFTLIRYVTDPTVQVQVASAAPDSSGGAVQ